MNKTPDLGGIAPWGIPCKLCSSMGYKIKVFHNCSTMGWYEKLANHTQGLPLFWAAGPYLMWESLCKLCIMSQIFLCCIWAFWYLHPLYHVAKHWYLLSSLIPVNLFGQSSPICEYSSISELYYIRDNNHSIIISSERTLWSHKYFDVIL